MFCISVMKIICIYKLSTLYTLKLQILKQEYIMSDVTKALIELIDKIKHNFIIVNMTIYNQRLTLVNLYGPNSDNPNFFKLSSNHIDDNNNTDMIICGD